MHPWNLFLNLSFNFPLEKGNERECWICKKKIAFCSRKFVGNFKLAIWLIEVENKPPKLGVLIDWKCEKFRNSFGLPCRFYRLSDLLVRVEWVWPWNRCKSLKIRHSNLWNVHTSRPRVRTELAHWSRFLQMENFRFEFVNFCGEEIYQVLKFLPEKEPKNHFGFD